MKIEITAVPKFWLFLSLAQVKLLCELSKSHYDGTCRNASEVGGFLYGWTNCVTPPFAVKEVGANFRELDLCLKMLEMRGHLPKKKLAVADDMAKSFCEALMRGQTAFKDLLVTV